MAITTVIMVRRGGQPWVRLLPILALCQVCLAWLSPTVVVPTVGRTKLCPAIATSTAIRAVFTQPKFFRNSTTAPAGSSSTSSKIPSFSTSSSSSPRHHPKSDGKIAQEHIRRIRSAGRVGTKRFVDPCRVFVGNLNFTTTEASLAKFVEVTLGLPAGICLNDVKVVRDWKTKTSKGYGFCVFTDPVYATLFIDKGHHQLWDGRRATVSQGAKKPSDNTLFVQKNAKRSESADEEERTIGDAVRDAEDDNDDDDDEEEEELALLRLLDPDLVGGNNNNDDYDYDGVETNSSMNRAQRRQSEREKKRTKPPSKGFG